MLFCRVLIEIYVWFKCWMIWDCKEDVDGLYVWQSVILDKERNCNLGDVLLVLNEWLIITTKFLYGCHLWIRHSILQKYEDSMSNCVLSTKTELYLYTKKKKKVPCPLNISHCDRGFSIWKCSWRYVIYCLTKTTSEWANNRFHENCYSDFVTMSFS